MKVFPTPQKYKKALRLSWCNTQQMSLHQQRTKLRIGAIWLKKKIFSFQQKITTFTLSKTKDTFVNIAHIQKQFCLYAAYDAIFNGTLEHKNINI